MQRESENLYFHTSTILTMRVLTKNSAAIDRAPGARSKSVEVFVRTPIVNELRADLVRETSKIMLYLLGSGVDRDVGERAGAIIRKRERWLANAVQGFYPEW